VRENMIVKVRGFNIKFLSVRLLYEKVYRRLLFLFFVCANWARAGFDALVQES
jgi:hypothetical protein